MKACKKCHKIYSDDINQCSNCQDGSEPDFTDRYNSVATIFDAERSEIAKRLGFKTPGRYAVKVK